jgi:thiol:disulfide interchange protein DsbA
MKMLGSLMLGLLLSLSATAKDFQAGKEYVVLSKPQPVNSADKIEVIEFFWYACPHCYQLEPTVNTWKKNLPDNVEFIRVPAVLGPNWELLARGYYTAEVLGVVDKIHAPLFDYLHKSRKRIRNVGDLKTFFVSQGVSEADFEKTFKSFAVVTKTNRAKQASQRYGLDSVPTLVVAGKYRTGPSIAGGNKRMFEVVNHLTGLESVSQSSEPAAAATP